MALVSFTDQFGRLGLREENAQINENALGTPAIGTVSQRQPTSVVAPPSPNSPQNLTNPAGDVFQRLNTIRQNQVLPGKLSKQQLAAKDLNDKVGLGIKGLSVINNFTGQSLFNSPAANIVNKLSTAFTGPSIAGSTATPTIAGAARAAQSGATAAATSAAAAQLNAVLPGIGFLISGLLTSFFGPEKPPIGKISLVNNNGRVEIGNIKRTGRITEDFLRASTSPIVSEINRRIASGEAALTGPLPVIQFDPETGFNSRTKITFRETGRGSPILQNQFTPFRTVGEAATQLLAGVPDITGRPAGSGNTFRTPIRGSGGRGETPQTALVTRNKITRPSNGER